MADEEEMQQQEEATPKTGLMCFLNSERECGADCMAYNTYPSESPYLDEQQKHCTFIVGVERVGRYAGGILKLIKDANSDSIREKNSKPSTPTPTGA